MDVFLRFFDHGAILIAAHIAFQARHDGRFFRFFRKNHRFAELCGKGVNPRDGVVIRLARGVELLRAGADNEFDRMADVVKYDHFVRHQKYGGRRIKRFFRRRQLLEFVDRLVADVADRPAEQRGKSRNDYRLDASDD